MEIIRWESGVVVLALAEADVKLLSACFEPEAVLEVGPSNNRHEHAMSMQSSFVAMTEALRLQDQVLDVVNALRACAADPSLSGVASGIAAIAADDLAEVVGEAE